MNYWQSLNKVLNHPLNTNQKAKALLRILWWKSNQLVFKLPTIVNFTKETKIICDPDSSYGSYVIYVKFPEYEEMQFIYDYLGTADVYVDVGAHIGSEILLAASKIKKGQIYGFEPTDKIFEKLKTNLRLNGLEKKAKVFQKIISDKNGFEKFALKKESEINHIAINSKEGIYQKITSINLDTFIKFKKINFVDFLKIDVEGAEHKVFKGLEKNLKNKKIGLILFELNNHLYDYQSSPQKLLTFIKKFDYSIYKITNDLKLKKINVRKFEMENTINLVAVANLSIIKQRIKPWLI